MYHFSRNFLGPSVGLSTFCYMKCRSKDAERNSELSEVSFEKSWLVRRESGPEQVSGAV